MSRSLRHGALAATATALSIFSLSACAAGNNAETLKIRPDNPATTVGDIKAQNVNVITQPGAGADGPAVVAATLFNAGTEREVLEAITLPGSDVEVKLQAAGGKGPIVVPAGGQVIIGGKGNAAAVIENSGEAARNGDVQQVVFKLSRTGDVALGASVFPAEGFFKDFGPSPKAEAPAPKPSPTPSGSATGDAETPGTAEGATGGTPADGAAAEGATGQGETGTQGQTGTQGDAATQGAGDGASVPAAD
ncbi:hypothetical protein IX27_32240 [Streptomyces sp. JS01]|uniref:hypothetical protein n=1 Tax=Streptomyces TaxID=1883 RepID=UPI000503663A|nr:MULTISPECIES: hypothetical protein [unclassified Streptomyces]KFK85654.1 hypothetical protein IX27_32240 [Streptomyces sp. JS01]MBK3528938.1 DUF461 domain-containing protein [Streptomyces sp. MBT72]MBK3535474.1 DUF461 domain-containing protein [Streptomyces sp. MBT67]MBK3550486.1 DUF461 domain-containing protein [Streptomyces sp. MBT61]MBK6027612.1 DUF461 domain-containing protein [Streptomyces sp. MBT59]